MAEFEEALNNILADPDAMGQIMALAGKLGGGQPGPSPDASDTPNAPDASEAPETEDAAAEVAAAEQAPPFQLPDLGQLGQIGQLGQLGTLLELFQNRSQGKAENIALLQSLRPFLRPAQQRKLDRALRLAGLSGTARQLYQLWKEGELHV